MLDLDLELVMQLGNEMKLRMGLGTGNLNKMKKGYLKLLQRWNCFSRKNSTQTLKVLEFEMGLLWVYRS